MKTIWKYTCSRVWVLVTAIVMVIFLTATIVATQNLMISNTISTVMGGSKRVLVSGDPSQYKYYESDYNSKEEALAAANKLNEQIVEEGIVMLKNTANAMPLSAGSKVSVFGKNSVKLVYGGSGSGGGNTSGAVTIHDSLKSAGFDVNPTLTSFYNSKSSGSGRPSNPAMGSTVMGLATGETPQDSYSSDVKASYANYSDAALVVISRMGGEGFDLPRTSIDKKGNIIEGAQSKDSHYLQLDVNEKALISAVTTGSQFKKVIVIINCSTSMELDFIEDSGIDGALWIGSPGKTGINALGRILNGTVNPSGRLVDTYSRDFTKDPTWKNFGNNLVANGNRYKVSGQDDPIAFFVDYEEGIYLGYRYYETRGFTDGEAWYNNNVLYPLGYGLSYTNFSWELVESVPANNSALVGESITVKVKVTNTGLKAGKDVIQLYYTAPYTPGKIEKAHVVLGAFEKTGLIQPGADEIVTLELKVRDMASYDFSDANTNQFKGYELDAGAYNIKLSRNAHTPVLNLNYNLEKGIKYANDSATGSEVKNLFDDVSAHTTVYLSRNDWNGTFPTTPTVEDRTVTQAFINSLNFSVDDEGKAWFNDVVPKQSKNELSYNAAKVKLYNLIGKDYDDPLWDKLLDQLTVKQMSLLIGTGNFNTVNLDNISKPKTIDPDGPGGFTNFMGDPSVYGTCFYASECVLGSTYNKALANEMGKAVGNEGIWGDQARDGRPYSGWYAPAANIHRSPFSGRNWEYYSEDGLLSGLMGAEVVKGAKSKGVYTYVKHFALNDQETNRDSGGLLTFANEQTMREIYFKAFEVIVKEGKTTAMMSSFNRIGTVWTGGDYRLLTQLLRNEWGFKGMVITDYNTSDHMPADQMIRAGGDLNLFQDKQPSITKPSATQVNCIRNAAKNILYTVAGSNAMNGMGDGVIYKYTTPDWVIMLILVNVALAVGFGVWGFFAVKTAYKRKKLGIEPKSKKTKTTKSA